MLKIQNISKHFGGIHAVNNCNFEIKKGKITALIGPNGSGKSTIFNLITGLLKPDSGRIIFNGKDITKISVDKISNLGISRIFQKSRLFNNLTIKQNMLLAFDNEDEKFWKNLFALRDKTSKAKEKRIKEMLSLVRMEKHENKLGRNLSYGQKRLVEIVRAVIKPHKILMLDEPIAGVAPNLKVEVAKLLIKLRDNGETIFLIEHDMNFILKIADEVIVIDEGKVLAKGNPKQIKENKKVLQAYLGG